MKRTARLFSGSLAGLLGLLVSLPLAGQPVRLGAEVFGEPVHVEVRDLPADDADEAAREAIREMQDLERLTDLRATDSEPVGVAAVHESGGGPLAVDPRLFALLERTRDFCAWSDGAQGPLGGRLYRVWEAVPEPPPSPEDLTAALATTLCRHLQMDPESSQIALAAGARLDLRHFALGAAVDRAVEILQNRGSGNGFVQVGSVRRGFGEGPAGDGWRVLLPVFPGYRKPLHEVWLQDQSVAVTRASDGPHAYLDLRTGQPPDGIVGVVAVTETGTDAQGLATSLFVLGPRQGQFRLGQLRPEPAALWLLGSGEGRPLRTDYGWAKVRTR